MTNARHDVTVAPWLDEYESARATFDWHDAWNELGGDPAAEMAGDRGVNIADCAVDRHVRRGNGDDVALRWLARDDSELSRPVDITYLALSHRTNRFATALLHRGFSSGDGLASLAGRIPELYVAALGALKAQCVYTPLFSAFGPDPIVSRMTLGHIKVLLTTPVQFRRKVLGLIERLPDLELIVLAGDHEEVEEAIGTAAGVRPEVVSYGRLLGEGRDWFAVPPTAPETPALLHFTSGTTGTPKGAVHVHGAVISHHVSAKLVLDLHPHDVYWCTADPGWVTGTSYGIIAPLTNGVVNVIDEAEFDVDRWYRILDRFGVNVWYTAPTAIRMLERQGADAVPIDRFDSLRLVASVGEPLDAESVLWCNEVFGVPVLDTWWQTETGSIMIANFRSQLVQPGSMGRPVPGVDVALLRWSNEGDGDADDSLVRDGEGHAVLVDDPDEFGELAIRTGWPSMFRGYLEREDRYQASFVDGWYRSGDLARRGVDGYYWFVGRGDDVIKTSGHLIGPFEVESALNEHPSIVESGVIGKPDPTAGSIVKAFVTLVRGVEPSDALHRDVVAHARRKLGSAVAPREIEFVEDLPHTRSGKIMRRVLKAREMGTSEGDLSTLEPSGRSPARSAS